MNNVISHVANATVGATESHFMGANHSLVVRLGSGYLLRTSTQMHATGFSFSIRHHHWQNAMGPREKMGPSRSHKKIRRHD